MQTAFRIAKREAVIGGKTIRAGEGVILLTGSATRDDAAFSERDRLDIARKGPKHAAFGHGMHQCIGAELARMETERSHRERGGATRADHARGARAPVTGARRPCEVSIALRCMSNDESTRRTHDGAQLD